jgi:hypothetical protein
LLGVFFVTGIDEHVNLSIPAGIERALHAIFSTGLSHSRVAKTLSRGLLHFLGIAE